MDEQPLAPEDQQTWSDQQVDITISNILRFGVLTASFVVVIGACIYLSCHWADTPTIYVFTRPGSDLREVRDIFLSALSGNAKSIIQLGIAILLATPILRVAFGAFAFAKQKDWTYVAITMAVLSMLLYSLIAGQV